MQEMKKVCSACPGEKPISHFAIKNSYTGQLQSRCKECMKIINKDYYQRKKTGGPRKRAGPKPRVIDRNFTPKVMIPMTPRQAESLRGAR